MKILSCSTADFAIHAIAREHPRVIGRVSRDYGRTATVIYWNRFLGLPAVDVRVLGPNALPVTAWVVPADSMILVDGTVAGRYLVELTHEYHSLALWEVETESPQFRMSFIYDPEVTMQVDMGWLDEQEDVWFL